MKQESKPIGVVVAGIALLLLSVGAWLWTRMAVLSALPVGLLFGFFLQKGDLCGASAMSEVVVFRDARKLVGLWIAIVVSMLGFALGAKLGLVTLAPKPLFWALYVIGGLVFGAGTVLAGGCVSGCLYKGATGNLNSIVALLAMPVGIAVVEYGPLEPNFVRLKALGPAKPGAPALDLPAVTGLSFFVLALVFAFGTLAVALWRRRATARPTAAGKDGEPAQRDSGLIRLLYRPWRPWVAGVAIGILALPAYMSSVASGRNYALGVTHGVLQAEVLLTDHPVKHITSKAPSAPKPEATPGETAKAGAGAADAAMAAPPAAASPKQKKIVWWLVLVVAGLAAGAYVAGRLSGQVRLLPKPPEQVLVAVGGGFLVGAGAALGTGCVIGNILSGWALMSVGMLLFGVCTLAGNWAVTYFYLMGGSLGRK